VGRGYWRMKVYRRYPGKAAGDSYTPWTMKVQLAAAAGGAAALAVGLFFPSVLPLSLIFLALLGLRTLALLTGMVAGLVRFRPFLGGGD